MVSKNIDKIIREDKSAQEFLRVWKSLCVDNASFEMGKHEFIEGMKEELEK